MSKPGDAARQDSHEVVQFGADRIGRRWPSRVLLACLVVVTAVTVAIQGTGHQARPAAKQVRLPPVRVTTVGRRLLGVTASWELFARGPDDLLRIQLARGQITTTYVPPLESANPDVAFVIGAREVVIRSTDYVPGYMVPDGHQARLLTGPLAGGGPLVPGPAGTQAAWVATGLPTSPTLSLAALTGQLSGTTIRFPPGGPQLTVTAVSDGRGYVLVTTGSYTVYDVGPGWARPLPGAVVAIGPTTWLVVACNPLYRHCRNEVIDHGDGVRRVLPGPATAETYYFFSWPPAGVIAPDGSAAAVAATGRDGRLSVHLIDLHTGSTRDLNVRLGVGVPGSDLPLGPDSTNGESMVWSPDSRWLFVAAAGGKLIAVNARTGRAETLGVTLPPVDQVAIRA